MANILTLKRRIQTAQNVSKTTKAMQMIAASKLKKAQEATLQTRPYVDKLAQVSTSVAAKVDRDNLHEYMRENSMKRDLMIVISPDKGLCGSLITNLLKEVLTSDSKDTVYIAVGKKMELNLLKLGKEVIASFPFGTTLPPFDIVYPVITLIDEYFLGKKVSKVSILSTDFRSVFTQKPTIKTMLPIKLTDENKPSETMLFEPSIGELLPSILRHFIEMSLYQSILETYASEQAARMIAMKNATDNANDIVDELKLEYNKGRQEKITNEILDIGGATFASNYEN